MTHKRTLVFVGLAAVLALMPVLSACGATATPTALPTAAPTTGQTAPTSAPPTSAPTSAPPTRAPTQVPATATAKATGPKVGGNLVWAVTVEPDTLDPDKTGFAVSDLVNNYLGGALVTLDVDGNIIPWLADKWTISEDGLTYTFTVKSGIKFHNGDVCDATSFAYAYNRALDPATKATASASMLGGVTKIEAVDDSTLVLTLAKPNYFLLETLAAAGYLMPLDQKAVEAAGEQYGRNPVGVGPYKFKSWTTGQSVVVERNPDFNWGPPNIHQGPWYIQTITFRIIPDYSTELAGMEAGELDYIALETKDVANLKTNPKVAVIGQYQPGLRPGVWFNDAKAPFTDVKVRQAFNYAVDQKQIIQVVFAGDGITQYGPVSVGQIGYQKEIESAGQPFDLAKAKSLMQEAGYTYGSDGMLSKDGKPLKLTMLTLTVDQYIKTAQVLQNMYKALGVNVELQQIEQGVMIPQMMQGNYDMGVLGISYTDVDVLYMMFHSSQVGAGLNLSQVKDPTLDKLLEDSRSVTDPTKHNQIELQLQTYIAQNALIGPLCTPMNYVAFSSRVKGYVVSPLSGVGIIMGDAYIEQ